MQNTEYGAIIHSGEKTNHGSISFDMNNGNNNGSAVPNRRTIAVINDNEYDYADDDNNTRGRKNTTVPLFVYIFAGIAALNSCNLGFDIGVGTSAALVLKNSMNLDNIHIELFIGSINLFAILGAIGASKITDLWGLRGSFLVASIGFVLGVLLMASANTFEMLMFGRFFVGLGVGFGMAIGPVYIAEISPKSHRGKLASWSEIGINVGIFLGFAAGILFHNVPPHIAWRLMFSMGAIIPTIMILLAIFVLSESPRWLISTNRLEEARQVLDTLTPPGESVDDAMNEIKESIEEEKRMNQSISWSFLLISPPPSIQRMLLVGCGVAICQQLSGIDAIQYYLIFILDREGITDRLDQAKWSTTMCALKVSCLFISGPLFDKYGRRPMMFLSLAGMAASLALIASTFYLPSSTSSSSLNTIMVLTGLTIYLASFSLGLGPLAWVIPPEVYATIIRTKAMSLSTFLNRLTATIISTTMLSMAKFLTWGGYFIQLCIMCLLIGIFLYIYLPETNGKALEDMMMYFVDLTGDTTFSSFSIQKYMKKNNDDYECMNNNGVVVVAGDVIENYDDDDGNGDARMTISHNGQKIMIHP